MDFENLKEDYLDLIDRFVKYGTAFKKIYSILERVKFTEKHYKQIISELRTSPVQDLPVFKRTNITKIWEDIETENKKKYEEVKMSIVTKYQFVNLEDPVEVEEKTDEIDIPKLLNKLENTDLGKLDFDKLLREKLGPLGESRQVREAIERVIQMVIEEVKEDPDIKKILTEFSTKGLVDKLMAKVEVIKEYLKEKEGVDIESIMKKGINQESILKLSKIFKKKNSGLMTLIGTVKDDVESVFDDILEGQSAEFVEKMKKKSIIIVDKVKQEIKNIPLLNGNPMLKPIMKALGLGNKQKINPEKEKKRRELKRRRFLSQQRKKGRKRRG